VGLPLLFSRRGGLRLVGGWGGKLPGTP